MSDELIGLSARAIAGRIADGRISAVEVVEAHIDRIQRVDPDLNAVVVERFESARREARATDERADRGEPLGALHGVPITVKECFDVAGLPTTGGVPGWRDNRADADSPLVARLREAGAILLGKTNVPELLLYVETDNPLHGRTNNPWRPDRSPGGSSGGEGAIIAAGGSALGIGTDLGGSIRLPAHACGIHGLKPTAGRLTIRGTFDELLLPGQEAIPDAAGPLARHVEDLTLAMRVLVGQGHDPDPRVPPVPWLEPDQVPVEDLRVGYYTDDGFLRPAPALRRAVEEAAAALEAEGLEVREFRPPGVGDAMRLFFGLLSSDGAAWAREVLGSGKHDRRIRDTIRLARLPAALRAPVTVALRVAGQRRLATAIRSMGARSARAYVELVSARARYRDEFLAGLDSEGIDVLLCPPSAHPALTHGASYYLTLVASYTMLYNLLDLPAGVVAATRVSSDEESDREPGYDIVERTARKVEECSAGLPVGVQVAARPWREDLVLRVMSVLEGHFRGTSDYPAGAVASGPGPAAVV